MESTAAQNLDATNENWHADQQEALNCPHFDLQLLIDRVLERWESASIGYRAIAYAQLDRTTSLKLARSLREAEQAIFAIVSAAVPSFQEGYVTRLDELVLALIRCRTLIVLPVARRMAEHERLDRSADDIALLIAKSAQFIGGRAVIDQALADKLPAPYKAEAVSA